MRRNLVTGQVLAPEERLSVLQALKMYTKNDAYVGLEENRKGSLDPGKLADFVVIDRDVLTVPPDKLKEVQALRTFVDGNLAYEKSQ